MTETVPTGWTLSDRTGGTTTGVAGIEFTTSAAGTPIAFENTLNTEVLTISKDVTGVAATAALEGETFTISVECTRQLRRRHCLIRTTLGRRRHPRRCTGAAARC